MERGAGRVQWDKLFLVLDGLGVHVFLFHTTLNDAEIDKTCEVLRSVLGQAGKS